MGKKIMKCWAGLPRYVRAALVVGEPLALVVSAVSWALLLGGQIQL